MSTMNFGDAYDAVIDRAAEGVDVDSVYRNLGLDPEFADNASKLMVALVIINSGCFTGHLPSEVASALQRASRNIIERGQVDGTTPEEAAESMNKMRSMI